MNLSVQQIKALYKLYPNAVRTDGDKAFDKDDNLVDYDLDAITAQGEADAQTAISHKESALAKLSAIGLTDDEIKALLK